MPDEKNNQNIVDEAIDKIDTSTIENDANTEKTELDIAKEQIQSITDKFMRTAAEFDNYKKRTLREKDDFYKIAVCETISPLLPVLDNIERAIIAAEETTGSESVIDGIKMIKKQFDDALSTIGVTPIEAVGNEFDPEKHNAVMMADSDKESNIIIDEFQKGYLYKDKVIRHSMVKVSN